MALSQFVQELKETLSSKTSILTDASSKEFQLALLRWSDVGITVPGAIIKVASEHEVVTTASQSSSQIIVSTNPTMTR